MTGVLTLYRTTVGKKVAMALSGAVYIGWVLFHLAGNSTFHLGPAAINDYAHHIQANPVIVWGGRSTLFLALAIHVISAIALVRHNAGLRKGGYRAGHKRLASTSGSKSMRYGGMALLLFLVWHVADLTLGLGTYVHELMPVYKQANLGFIRGEVYHNMLMSFANPISGGIYVLAMIFLGLHLYHGAWSCLQTLGFDSASRSDAYKKGAAALAVLVVLGNLSIVGHGVARAVIGSPAITGHGAHYYHSTVDVPEAAKVSGAIFE